MTTTSRTAALLALTGVLAVTSAALAPPAAAQLVISANDGEVELTNGKIGPRAQPQPDTLALIDLSATPPGLIAELQAPVSEDGPPSSVAISPNEQIALVTQAARIDPDDPTRLVPDDTLTVIEIGKERTSIVDRLRSVIRSSGPAKAEPKVAATLKAGAGASGVAINKAGTLALVANHAEGTVSVFTIAGTSVEAAGKVDLGAPQAGPRHVAFLPNGRQALVTREGDHRITVLDIEGTSVSLAGRDLRAGLRPYALDIDSKGEVAVVANRGYDSGDQDTISVIDLKAEPPRVVDTLSIGLAPEGLSFSPDGNYVAVTISNGTTLPDGSPFREAQGRLVVLARSGTHLLRTAEASIGRWCQGVAWSKNGKTLAVQCMAEGLLEIFSFAGITAKALKSTGHIEVKGGPAAIATSTR